MSDRPRRARRCQLSVPGSSEKMLTKAAGLELDHVFLDLEDAVAPDAKPEARGKIVTALKTSITLEPTMGSLATNQRTIHSSFPQLLVPARSETSGTTQQRRS